eukprot:scaffold32639_cov112-Isochrysis_galbana.AAC.10
MPAVGWAPPKLNWGGGAGAVDGRGPLLNWTRSWSARIRALEFRICNTERTPRTGCAASQRASRRAVCCNEPATTSEAKPREWARWAVISGSSKKRSASAACSISSISARLGPPGVDGAM